MGPIPLFETENAPGPIRPPTLTARALLAARRAEEDAQPPPRTAPARSRRSGSLPAHGHGGSRAALVPRRP